jgi:2-methylisocitrate lyase-like PEP mutase family enzyme
MRATTRLRELIQGSDVVVAPGVFDGLSARLAGRLASRRSRHGRRYRPAMGVPDLGLLA